MGVGSWGGRGVLPDYNIAGPHLCCFSVEATAAGNGGAGYLSFRFCDKSILKIKEIK